MKIREVESVLKYRRVPYPKRSIELIAVLAISSTFFLFFHTNKLNSRLKEMEIKLQPSEISALGLGERHQIDEGKKSRNINDIYTLRGTYQYLRNTGQLSTLLPQELNNTQKTERLILFFNRLEKVGSQSMATLMFDLSKVNNFESYVNTPVPVKSRVQSENEIRTLAAELSSIKRPVSYVEHENWIDFQKYGYQKPIYINLIRHPIQKVMSAYYYIRRLDTFGHYFFSNMNLKIREPEYFTTSFSKCIQEEKLFECNFNNNIQYNSDWRRFAMHFCGQEKICWEFNSQPAAQIAKRNIEQEYAVVGSWEDTNITLTVLEHYIPRFFRGATQIFYSDPKKFHKNATPHNTAIDPNIEAKLKVQFAFEIELYNFAKQRLYKQFIAIKKMEMQNLFG